MLPMTPTDVKRSATRAKRPLRAAAPRIARPKVPALKRGLAVVRFLNGSLRLSAGVTEVSHSLGLTKSVAFNILKTLQEEGWVEFDIELLGVSQELFIRQGAVEGAA